MVTEQECVSFATIGSFCGWGNFVEMKSRFVEIGRLERCEWIVATAKSHNPTTYHQSLLCAITKTMLIVTKDCCNDLDLALTIVITIDIALLVKHDTLLHLQVFPPEYIHCRRLVRYGRSISLSLMYLNRPIHCTLIFHLFRNILKWWSPNTKLEYVLSGWAFDAYKVRLFSHCTVEGSVLCCIVSVHGGAIGKCSWETCAVWRQWNVFHWHGNGPQGKFITHEINENFVIYYNRSIFILL